MYTSFRFGWNSQSIYSTLYWENRDSVGSNDGQYSTLTE